LPAFNGDASWTLPMPGRFVVGENVSKGFLGGAICAPVRIGELGSPDRPGLAGWVALGRQAKEGSDRLGFREPCRVVLSAVAPFWAALDDKLSGCLRGLHDAERNSGCFGEAGAAGGGGNGLVVTTTATEQMTEFAVLTVEAPG
jgi:hypothetical protein